MSDGISHLIELFSIPRGVRTKTAIALVIGSYGKLFDHVIHLSYLQIVTTAGASRQRDNACSDSYKDLYPFHTIPHGYE